jgi:hypothetical protein
VFRFELPAHAELGEFGVEQLQGLGRGFGRVDVAQGQELIARRRDVGPDRDQVALRVGGRVFVRDRVGVGVPSGPALVHPQPLGPQGARWTLRFEGRATRDVDQRHLPRVGVGDPLGDRPDADTVLNRDVLGDVQGDGHPCPLSARVAGQVG